MTLRTVFRALQRLEAFVLSSAILLVASLTVVNVISRTLLGLSLAWVEEVSGFLMVVVTFVGLSYGASVGRHIRMTAIYDQLPERPRKALRVFIAASTALLLFGLAGVAADYTGTVATLGSVSPALQLPLWWVYAVAPIGLTLGAVQYVLITLQNLKEPGVWLSPDRTDGYDTHLEAHL